MRGYYSETNPNDGIGGGGCVCSPLKCEDCKGPFVVFPATETDSNQSPHVVISVHCARQIAEGEDKAQDEGQILSAGEADPVEVEPDLL